MVEFKAVAGREIASPNIARTKWNPLSQPAVDLRVDSITKEGDHT
jgi:hypothetical protein